MIARRRWAVASSRVTGRWALMSRRVNACNVRRRVMRRLGQGRLTWRRWVRTIVGRLHVGERGWLGHPALSEWVRGSVEPMSPPEE